MVGAISDIGNFRNVNEDYIDYYICHNYQLYIVADGMGGHNAGDMASKMCVNKVKEYIIEKYDKYKDIKKMLSDSVKYANRAIHFKSLDNKKYKGMGTTLTIAFVCDGKIYVVNVGDSCFFVINKDVIKKITKDHSLVQQLIDDGILTQDEAKNYPNKNIITRSVGINESVEVDLFLLDENKESFYLLCTDGLLNVMDYKEIVPYLNENKVSLSEVCNELVDLVKKRGGRDNISLIIFGGTNDR